MPVHETYRDGVVISRVEVPASVGEVKAEAQRRIIALCGAVSMDAALIKQLNAAMRAITLIDARKSRALTPEEEAEASALRALADGIVAIRAASNLIEQSPPIEISIDPRWP